MLLYRIFFAQSRQATTGGKNLVRIVILSSGHVPSQSLQLKVISLVSFAFSCSVFNVSVVISYTPFVVDSVLPSSSEHKCIRWKRKEG